MRVTVRLKRWRRRMSCSKKKTLAIKIVALFCALIILQVLLSACSGNDNISNNSDQDSNSDIIENNQSEENNTDEPEYVEVEMWASKFNKYFTITKTYSTDKIFLYTLYYTWGKYGEYKVPCGAMYNFTRTCNFTIKLKDDSIKIKNPIKGIVMKVSDATQWRGQSVNVVISESGTFSGIITASADGSSEPLPAIDMIFGLNLGQIRGTLLVPKDKVIE